MSSEGCQRTEIGAIDLVIVNKDIYFNAPF